MAAPALAAKATSGFQVPEAQDKKASGDSHADRPTFESHTVGSVAPSSVSDMKQPASTATTNLAERKTGRVLGIVLAVCSTVFFVPLCVCFGGSLLGVIGFGYGAFGGPVGAALGAIVGAYAGASAGLLIGMYYAPYLVAKMYNWGLQLQNGNSYERSSWADKTIASYS